MSRNELVIFCLINVFLIIGWEIGCGPWIKTKICLIAGTEMATNSK